MSRMEASLEFIAAAHAYHAALCKRDMAERALGAAQHREREAQRALDDARKERDAAHAQMLAAAKVGADD